MTLPTGAAAQGANFTDQRWLTLNRTLIFITNGDSVLLMKRASHKRVFPGYYNGVGGHIEHGEDPLTGALREVREETGLTSLQEVRLRGISHIDAGNPSGIMLFVFTAQSESRSVGPCDEGELHWIPLAEALTLPLVDDLPLIWERLFGASQSPIPFFASVSYNAQDRMILTFADTPNRV